jgi:hypothetical protein
VPTLKAKVSAITGALALAALSQAAQGAPVSLVDAAHDGIVSITSEAMSQNGALDITRLPMILQGYQTLNSPSPSVQGTDQARVPEPATLSLLGLGLAALGIGRGRKRK